MCLSCFFSIDFFWENLSLWYSIILLWYLWCDFHFLNCTWCLLPLNLSTHAIINSGILWTTDMQIYPPNSPVSTIKYQLLTLLSSSSHPQSLCFCPCLSLPLVFATKSHYVTQATLQLTILSSLPGLQAFILKSSPYVWISQMFRWHCLSSWDLSKCCWVYCLFVPSRLANFLS